jgi:type IV secretory pathway VirB2 component (pilin)
MKHRYCDTVDSLLDPTGASPIEAAVDWLQGTLLGTVATTVAVIAVASIGYGMLTGRINWRYGSTVIIGCFILFGASSIVGGIRSTLGSSVSPEVPQAYTVSQQAPPQLMIPQLPPGPPRPPYDPYAGAAVPPR